MHTLNGSHSISTFYMNSDRRIIIIIIRLQFFLELFWIRLFWVRIMNIISSDKTMRKKIQICESELSIHEKCRNDWSMVFLTFDQQKNIWFFFFSSMQPKTNKKELLNRKIAFHQYRNAKKVSRGRKKKKKQNTRTQTIETQ